MKNKKSGCFSFFTKKKNSTADQKSLGHKAESKAYLDASMPINERLALGAIAYARKLIRTSSTLPELTSDQKETLAESVKEMRGRHLTTFESLRELFNVPASHVVRSIKRPVRSLKKMAKYNKDPVGNCGEYADAVLNFLRKNNVDYAERCLIQEGGGHVFVVIGRDPKSDPNKPLEWGEKAIICDAWANFYCKSSEIYEKLKCYRHEPGVDKPNIVYPFTANHSLVMTGVIVNGHNVAYQEKLINETQQKLELIRTALESQPAINSIQIQEKILNLQARAKNVISAETTDFDAERKLNKLLTSAFDLISNLSLDTSDKRQALNSIKNELSKNIFSYIEKHASSKEFKEFLEDAVSIFSGQHSDDIKSMADAHRSIKPT